MSQQPIFQSTLQDLIKGIRANKKDPSSFISKEIADIKAELRCTDPFMKAEAVRKLTYLQMVGYNVSWAAFAIVEVMSQPRFGHKRIGYLAANQTFDENTEVILLTTNLFKKEFGGTLNSSQYEVGLAINCLANIANKDLARDCISDLVLLMNHTRPYIRKKAVLCMYKLYVKFPQGLRLTFEKLKDRLDDSESAVVSTAVNVICELANKNPRNYLAMAPKFFKLLTTSSNNWMLIKVVKLLGSLVSEEPRLARKLLEPLATIIQNTGAKSLQYECIYTLTEALPYSTREDGTEAKNAPAVIKLCSDYLRGFIEDSDQNLKYLGLVGLVKLMRSSPRSAVEHREIVLQCLSDDDATIRTKALEVLAGIVSRKSLVDLVHHLMKHALLAEGAYRNEVVSKILFMCRKEKYALVEDFAWYTSVLLDLAVMPGIKHGAEVADQLIEVALRVVTVRPYAVEMMLSMLLNEQLVLGHARETVCEVLKAAAWIVGEYSDIVTRIVRDRSDSLNGTEEEDEGDETVFWIEGARGNDLRSTWRGQKLHYMIMEALLHPRTTNLPALVQKVYLQAALKVFVRASGDCDVQDLADVVGVVRRRLSVFMQSQELEVQERATTFRQLLAELDILPLNWEESTEEISRETPGAAVVTAHHSGDGAKGLNAKERELMDLLEFPMYTQTSVRAVDEHGAKLAVEKSAVLHTLVAEEFYAVHSKAQRRVPVPEELDLEKPLNASALDALLATEIPDGLTLANLSLVQTYQPTFNAYGSGTRGLPQGEDAQRSDASRTGGLLAESQSIADRVKAAGTAGSVGWDHSTVTSGYTTKVSDDVFMLPSGSKSQPEIIPLSKILGDTFEDASGRARSGKTQGRRVSKRRGGEINVVEMVPAGAVSSDEDEFGDRGVSGRRKGHGSSSRSKNDKRGTGKSRHIVDSDEEVDLGGVDITTPLRDDEVLHVPTHRVVESRPDRVDREDVWRNAGEVADGDGEVGQKPSKEKKRRKKDKDRSKDNERSSEKHRSKEERKEKKHRSKGTGDHGQADLLQVDDLSLSEHTQPRTTSSNRSDSANLLGLDFSGSAAVAPVAPTFAQAPVPSTSDRIAAMFDSADAARKAQAEAASAKGQRNAFEGAAHHSRGDEKVDKAKKGSSGRFWQPAYSDHALDVFYAVSADSSGRSVRVQWKVANRNDDGAAVSVSVLLDSPLLSANPCRGSFVPLAVNLAAGTEVKQEMQLGLFNPIEDEVVLPCRVAISAESLLGPEVRNITTELRVTICATFSSQDLTVEAFAQTLSNSSGAHWGSASTQVRISGKPKSAFKALAGFLGASIVEAESSKAASMAARTSEGYGVYVLAKAGSSGKSMVQLDVKCTCQSRAQSEKLAKLVAGAVSALSL